MSDDLYFGPHPPNDDGFIVPPAVGHFAEWFEDMMPEAMAWFRDQAENAEPFTGGHPTVVPLGGPFQELSVTRRAAVIDVPDELLMDCGVIPDTREHKPIPWRWRLKWKIQNARTRLAEIAYRVVAGDWPCGGEDE